MKWIGILALFFALTASGQTVAVSATITDPNSNAFYLGTYTLTLAQPDGSPLYNPTSHGLPITTARVTGTLNSSGSFSVNVLPNTLVDQPSVWLVQIQAPTNPTIMTIGSPWVINYKATITGSTDLSAVLSAKASALAYLDLSNGKSTFPAGTGTPGGTTGEVQTNGGAGFGFAADRYTSNTYSLSSANTDQVSLGGGRIIATVPTTLSSVQQIGSATVANQLLLGNNNNPITLSTGGGFQLCNASRIEGMATFPGSQAALQLTTGAAIADVIAPCKNDTTQESMSLSNVNVTDHGHTGIAITGTITSGSNSITGIASTAGITPGNVIIASSIPANTLVATVGPNSLTMTQNATANGSSATVVGAVFHISSLFSGTHLNSLVAISAHSGYAFLLDGGVYQSGGNSGKPGFTSDISLNNFAFWGDGNSGLPVAAVLAPPNTPGGAGIETFSMTNGDVEACSQGNPLLLLNGFAAGNGGGNLNNGTLNTIDYEARCLANGLKIRDAHKIEALNNSFEAPSPQSGPVAGDLQAAAVVIDETYLGATTLIHVSGHNNNWPTTLMDWVSAHDIASLTGAITQGATSFTIAGLGTGGIYPLPGQPVMIMDGQQTEIVSIAYPYSGGNTFSISTGTQFAHPGTAQIAWNPVWLAGPGPAGLNAGVYFLGAGTVSNDGTGVVTVTVPTATDNFVYEDRHIGEYVTVSATSSDGQFQLGRVQITGLGPWCTVGGVQATCSNNQFQFISATHTSYTNTAAINIYIDTVVDFDYYVTRDKGQGTVSGGVGVKLPNIRGPVTIAQGATPTWLKVCGYQGDFEGFFSCIFNGYNNPDTGAVATDAYLEAQIGTSTNAPVTVPDLHVRTGPGGGNLDLGANGNDYWQVRLSDGLLVQKTTSFPVAIINGTPTANNLAMFNSTTGQIQDSTVSNQNIAKTNAAITWTQQQNWSANGFWNAAGTATSGSNFNSREACVSGSYWNGTAAGSDTTCLVQIMGSGTNPTLTTELTRSGGNTGVGTFYLANSYNSIGWHNAAGADFYIDSTNVTSNTRANVPAAVSGASSPNAAFEQPGTTASIGGSALAAGACTTGTATMTGLTSTMTLVASPAANPGTGYSVRAYFTNATTATVELCNITTASQTPTSTTYNVRAFY